MYTTLQQQTTCNNNTEQPHRATTKQQTAQPQTAHSSIQQHTAAHNRANEHFTTHQVQHEVDHLDGVLAVDRAIHNESATMKSLRILFTNQADSDSEYSNFLSPLNEGQYETSQADSDSDEIPGVVSRSDWLANKKALMKFVDYEIEPTVEK